MCTGTTRTHVWNGHTEGEGGGRGRGRGRRHPRFFNCKTSVFDILEHLNRMLGSSLITNFLLAMNGPHRFITSFRGSPKKPLDLTFFENGASSIIERSALARCNVLIIRNKNTLQTIRSATFAPFLSCSFFFLFFYDDATRGTTTQGQRAPNQQRRATHAMTRHPTQQKKKTHTYTHMYMYL